LIGDVFLDCLYPCFVFTLCAQMFLPFMKGL
jgi:hypothetical protein